MSLILEALRKSEAERRRGEMPDLRAELPPPAAAQNASLRKTLPWTVAVLAAVVATTLVVLHPWSHDTTTTSVPAPATTPPVPTETIRMQPRPEPVVATRVEAPRIAEREPPEPRTAHETAMPVPVAETPPATTAPEPEPPIPPTTADAKETSINALPADLRKALPPLQLSMHMWNPDPAKRFVILDGERHVEGDSIGPMRIRRIDADGVLFDWQGRAVRLPLR